MVSILKVDNIQNTAGTDVLTIDSSGRVLMPQLVAFSAKWANGGNTTNAYLQTWTVTCNQGGAFDASNGIFTAPVDGTYAFHLNILGENFSGTDTDIYFVKNASSSSETLFRLRDSTRNSRFQSLSGSIIVDLVSSDEISVNTAAYLTSHTDPWHILSGYLLG